MDAIIRDRDTGVGSKVTTAGEAMVIRAAKRSTANLAAINAELVHDVSGDDSVVIYLLGTATANGTYNIQGSADGTNFFDLLAYPYGPASAGGTLPQPAQPMVLEAVNAATVTRMLCANVGGLQKVRVRLTAYTGGNFAFFINSDESSSISPYVRDQKSASLLVTVTAATGVAATATLPAVAGLRHYLDRVQVVRSLTALQTASATPTLVTTTNIPGNPSLTFGTDAGAQGVDREQILEFGSAGLACTAVNTATTIVCPATTGVIWRVNAVYRLGM